MFIDRVKYAITQKASFLIFIITLMATIIRPIFIDQDVIFTYIGIINTVVLGLVFLYIRFSNAQHWHPMFFVMIGLVVLIPIALVSGGVNSQFAFLFPIIPVFIALVSSPQYTWASTFVVILVIISLFLSTEFVPDFTYENVPSSKAESRALWLCFSVMLSAKFGIEFNRINYALGNKLSEQAEIDMLTGIANRRCAMSYLSTALDSAKDTQSTLAVMIIDLDHFKSINDTYGHLVGDACLKSAAQSISSSLRSDTDLSGRYGGEEFIVVIKDVTAVDAHKIADKIRSSIEKNAVSLDSKEIIKLSATVGVAVDDGTNLDSVEKFVEQADVALYQGKREGRNRVVLVDKVQQAPSS